MRRAMTAQARKLFGTRWFRWMNGEVSQFVFMSPGNPLHRGCVPLLAFYVLFALIALPLGMVFPLATTLGVLFVMFLLPPVASAIVVMSTLQRWRRSETLDEYAVLPFGRDALRTMLLLPSAVTLRWCNVVLAWVIALGPLLWVGSSMGRGAAAGGMSGAAAGVLAGVAASLLGLVILPFTIGAAYVVYGFACHGIPVGWYLATRFHGPNALALALTFGMRILLGFFVFPVAILAVWFRWTGGDAGLFDALALAVVAWFCFKQTWRLAYRLPRRWGEEDRLLLVKHGVDVLRSPEVFAAAAGNPSHLRVFWRIMWPWPTTMDFGEFSSE